MGLFTKLIGAGAVGGFVSACYIFNDPSRTQPSFNDNNMLPLKFDQQPTRQQTLGWLRTYNNPENVLDLLVVGGGAVGCGVALDASTRGLKVGLVEANDYASGTSSRSTKLIHGGVRYLEKAVLHLDPQQYNLVAEALHERAIMINQAPHLCRPLPTFIPCYDAIDVIKYYTAMKLYDAIAAVNRGTLLNSFFKRPVECLNDFRKMTHEDKDRQLLLGGVVYYDGQMDDARLCVSTALTAASYGAAVTNHTELVSAAQVTVGDQQLVKAEVFDRIHKTTFSVYTRCLVNAGGPFSDSIRKLAGDQRRESLVPSSGTHITLPAQYCPKDLAMLVPSQDGRVTFAVPWLGSCIVGTTDAATTVSWNPRGTVQEVSFLLNSLARYVGPIDSKEVKSVWCGIRPLSVKLPPATSDSTSAEQQSLTPVSTQDVVREHNIDVDPIHRVVSITGGKWTTYRKMAEDVVTAVSSSGMLSGSSSVTASTSCVTENIRLVGARHAAPSTATSTTTTLLSAVSDDVRRRWESAFGDRAPLVAAEAALMASKRRWGSTPATDFAKVLPGVSAQAITDAEIRYCALYEHCETVSDYLQRRSRLAFLNVAEARSAAPRVGEVMAEALGWSSKQRDEHVKDALASLIQFTVGN
jgi:glycerol-3-phosphate dehydrogenase